MNISRRELLWLAILAEGGLAALAGLLGWWLAEPPWQQTHFSITDAGLGFAASLPMLLVFVVFMRWPLGPWRHMRPLVDDLIRPIFRQVKNIDLVVICVLASVGEEWFFRGFIQGGLAPHVGIWWALGIASLLFGLFHPMSVFYQQFPAHENLRYFPAILG